MFKNIKIHKNSQVLILFSIITIVLHFTLHGLVILDKSYSIFYLDEEYSLGVVMTLGISFLTGVSFINYSRERKIANFRSYSIAGFFFLAFAFDEFFSVHEYLNTLLRADGSFLKNIADYSWILSLMILIVIAFGFLIYLTLKEKNIDVKRSFAIGIIIFFLILGIELIGGRLYGDSKYLVAVGIEEFLEMLGIIFFYNGISIKSEWTE